MPTVYVPDVTISLETISCCSCGVVFAMPAELKKKRLEDRDFFYCPNGHSQHYTGKTEAEKLREELAKKERDAQQLRESNARISQYWDEAEERRRAAERSVRGHKAVVTRMKRRVAAGSCPCCSKKFKNLEEHMKAEHPKWDPDRAAAELAAKVD